MLMTDLDPKLTFDTFVVGPANRLASAAAKRSADAPGTSYNPLFIYAQSGLGKTHILSAVAHHAQKANARLRVTYQTLEGYLGELERALESGQRDAMRDRYRDLDILLLDDVQFLAGQPEAQEMLLGALDALTASGSQIVLASDRPPADINGLDARLVSRFSGGLIVDIAAPEYETRVAIIRRKADEQGTKLGPGVAEALARFPARNVRELGGALNRVFAVQDLEERQVSVDEVNRMLGHAPAAPAAAAAPQGGAPAPVDDFASFMNELSLSVAGTVETQEEPWRKVFRQAAEAAEREGFNAVRLRRLMEGKEPKDWEVLAEKFKADLARLREIEAELDRLGNPWPDVAQGVVRDPDRLGEAESLLDSVEERMRPFALLANGPWLDDLEGFPTIAVKAGEQLVAADKPRYNPVYLWNRDARAAEAVLAAAGRTFQVSGARTAVTSVSAFSEDFIRALSAGVAGAWRERWWTVDLLLVYGTEGLAGTERAQDEFFHLFEALKRRGSRVLFTADRPPSEIGGIDERLRSRLQGGLVLEVETELASGPSPIVLVEPGGEAALERTDLDIWAGTLKDKKAEAPAAPVIPPLDQLVGDSGMVIAKQEPRPAPQEPGRGWMASGEKVVWNWPVLEDRLVEDFE
jgi:chromosomal replication initiation ATPase DnaA